MEIITTIADLRARLANEQDIAFVPTMGNLHEGHLYLMGLAREHGDCVVASIFVNSLQFGPSEDYDKYPRTLEADCAKLQGLVEVVFAPSVNEMYPEEQAVFVEPPPITNELDGESRPGHFRGMATVVLKLFNMVQPQVAIFGKKDYQQLTIIRQMVTQLNLPVEIVGAETIRAADGLAHSSRNQYLSKLERTESTFLHRTVMEVAQALRSGATNHVALAQQAHVKLVQRGWVVDYVAVRSQSALAIPAEGERKLVVLAAARLGSVRLIDNLEVGL